MNDRLAKLQAERAAIEAEIRAEKRRQNPPPWGEEGAALYAEIGRAIREARRDREMSQEQLAKAIEFARTSIVNIEAGRQRLTIDTLYDIADALKIQALSLLPRNEDV